MYEPTSMLKLQGVFSLLGPHDLTKSQAHRSFLKMYGGPVCIYTMPGTMSI